MTERTQRRDRYRPTAASGARVEKDGEKWTLVIERQLRHPPELVWEALTDPTELAEWAPFDASRDLGSVGTVSLATAGGPPGGAECVVLRADAPKVLEFNWGGNDLRWELEARGEGTERGTKLTLWTIIPKGFIAWGAAGWHICLDVLEHWLANEPLGRIVGPEAMKFDWQKLNAEYSEQFGIDMVPLKMPPAAATKDEESK